MVDFRRITCNEQIGLFYGLCCNGCMVTMKQLAKEICLPI